MSSTTSGSVPAVICLGEILIDFIADRSGPFSAVKRFKKFPGGAPANVAVGVARLGIHCGFIGKVSADSFGEFLLSTLQENGVDTAGVIRTDQAPTALAFVTRSPTGDRSFLFYRHHCADILLTEEELPLEWLKQTQLLHIGGVSLTREPSRQATLRAAEIAHKNGATVTFDPNLRMDLWPGGKPECVRIIRKALAFTNVFLPSEDELCFLMDTNSIDNAAQQALQLGPHLICIKQGAAGALVLTQSATGVIETLHDPAIPVKVVDTTGAGDGFNAGFITGLVSKLTLPDAVHHGNAVAAHVITKEGAMTALPTRTQLDTFLDEIS